MLEISDLEIGRQVAMQTKVHISLSGRAADLGLFAYIKIDILMTVLNYRVLFSRNAAAYFKVT